MATKSSDDFLQKVEKVGEQEKRPAIVQFYDLYERSLGALLEGTQTTPERFRGLIVETVAEQPDLTHCLTTPRGRQSLISSMRKVASLGFEPGSHLMQCWILPSRNRQRDGGYVWEAHVEIGYQGYKDLMYASGLIGYMKSEIIYDTDDVTFSFGTGVNDSLRVERDIRKTPGESIAYMVKVMMVSGHEYVRLLTRHEVNTRHMAFTRSKRSGNVVGPWRDHYDQMALKSCVLEARKDMPRKIALDIQRGIDVEYGGDIPLLEAGAIDVSGEVVESGGEEVESGGEEVKDDASNSNGG